MICYKDQTFCSSDCKNDKCFRHWSDEVHQAAREWWGHDQGHPPVAFSDFSKTCPEYIK